MTCAASYLKVILKQLLLFHKFFLLLFAQILVLHNLVIIEVFLAVFFLIHYKQGHFSLWKKTDKTSNVQQSFPALLL